MKKISISVLAIALALLLTNCGEKKSDKGDIAVTPTSDCMTSAYGCTGPYSQTQGFRNYGMQTPYGSSNGFCGCDNGYRPVYNNGWGMGCVQSNNIYTGQNYYSNTYYAPNNQWLSVPQTAYNPQVYGNYTNCYSDAVTACDARVTNSCAGGGYCRPIGGASDIGLCVYTNGR